MANPKPPTNHLKEPWKPGQSGNPHGRPKKLVTKLKSLGYKADQIRMTIENMLGMSEAALNDIKTNDKATVLEKALAQSVKNAIKSGKIDQIEMLFNRAYGKPKETVRHEGDDGAPIVPKTIKVEIVPPKPE